LDMLHTFYYERAIEMCIIIYLSLMQTLIKSLFNTNLFLANPTGKPLYKVAMTFSCI
jgi:hypothetical protein